MIGVPLPIEAVLAGIGEAAAGLAAAGGDGLLGRDPDHRPLAEALHAAGRRRHPLRPGQGRRDDEPNMATMLCFVQTDAVVDGPRRGPARRGRRSFERITVDGQMSTNDTVILQATGAAGAPLPTGLLEARPAAAGDRDRPRRRGRRPGRPGRGRGGRLAAEAERVARAIANSPLVKTALFGRDPNWGRIAQAAGAALVGEDLEEIGADSIDAAELGGETQEAEIGLRLGRGEHRAHVWFSDLGYEYVRINAEYTT